jgi:hypothetical protein
MDSASSFNVKPFGHGKGLKAPSLFLQDNSFVVVVVVVGGLDVTTINSVLVVVVVVAGLQRPDVQSVDATPAACCFATLFN